MQIIIPMAGTSNRFSDKGYSVPKQLIEVEGKPIIEHVVNIFPGEENFIFICNSNHLETTNQRIILNKIKPSGKIVEISPHNFGPVYTVLKASDYIKDDDEVIVNYCDFNVGWDYYDFKNKLKETNCHGALSCYTGFHPHLLKNNLYAGVCVNNNGFMTEIKEKYKFTEDPMETWHSSGTYYFKTGKILKRYLREVIEKDIKVNNEYYISVAYEFLLRDKLSCYVYPLKYFLQWGTPEDLEEYLKWSNLFTSIASGKMDINDSILSNDDQKIFNYWKNYFNQSTDHPYSSKN